ncbi:hypothetical protein GCM10029963_23120 [Micromonospora andamanensis]
MDDVTLRALRLLEEAQAGGASQVLAEAVAALREPTGELRDGPAAMHFARVVALTRLGDLRAAIAAADLMLVAAERRTAPGGAPARCRCAPTVGSASATRTSPSTTSRPSCGTSSVRRRPCWPANPIR